MKKIHQAQAVDWVTSACLWIGRHGAAVPKNDIYMTLLEPNWAWSGYFLSQTLYRRPELITSPLYEIPKGSIFLAVGMDGVIRTGLDISVWTAPWPKVER